MSVSCRLFYVIVIAQMSTITGCASIVSKSTYPVYVASKPEGATVTVTNRQGLEVYSGKTPATVDLKAGSGYFEGEEYTLSFLKDGYKPFKTTITADIDAWYIFGNIFIGGLIGWIIVDPATGAMWVLDNASVILLEDSISKSQKNSQVNIALMEDVPEQYHKLLKRNE